MTMEGILSNWETIVFPLVAIGYLELLRWVDNRWARRGPLTERECLTITARAQGASEYDIFRRSSVKWSIPAGRLEEDFKTYLNGDAMPHYVRDYLRTIKSLGT